MISPIQQVRDFYFCFCSLKLALAGGDPQCWQIYIMVRLLIYRPLLIQVCQKRIGARHGRVYVIVCEISIGFCSYLKCVAYSSVTVFTFIVKFLDYYYKLVLNCCRPSYNLLDQTSAGALYSGYLWWLWGEGEYTRKRDCRLILIVKCITILLHICMPCCHCFLMI